MTKKFKKTISLILTLAMLATFTAGCGSSETSKPEDAEKEKVTLKFMYFGSTIEKDVIANMVKKYMDTHPNVIIEPIHVPDENYDTKMSTLVASDTAPDIAYCNEQQAFDYALQGKILDLNPYFEKDTSIKPEDRFDQGKYYIGSKLIGMNTAMESIMLFYNKETFIKEGIELPPAEVGKAWTWDKFLEVAKKLTVDKNGKHPDDPGFDPENIKQYGCTVSTYWTYFYPFVLSNGGSIASEDGKTPMVDKPEFYEAVQRVADLMNKYHVAPNPAQRKSMPGTVTALQTGQVAMAVAGQWSILDLNASEVPFGIGLLPKINKPVTIGFGAPTVIFASTKYPEEAWDFYKYHNSVETATELFANGLWMPMEKQYYEKPELLDKWIKNDAHPQEYKTAVVDAFLNSTEQPPVYYLKNWGKITETMAAALDSVWMGKESAQSACQKLQEQLTPMMQGRYDEK